MADIVEPESFDRFYYQNYLGSAYERSPVWLEFFGQIADRIVADIAPRRVLDAGCAFGFLVEALRARGVEADGIDISAYAIGQVDPSAAPFCRQGSITSELDGSYDLVVSIEVLEHMTAREGERAVDNICAHTREVLFSSTPDDHREPTHVNVQPSEYWAELFARHGFYRDVDYDASFVSMWAVRFRKRDEPMHRVVRGYERRYARLQRERDEARAYSLELRAELARCQMPLLEQMRRVGRRIFGRRR